MGGYRERLSEGRGMGGREGEERERGGGEGKTSLGKLHDHMYIDKARILVNTVTTF